MPRIVDRGGELQTDTGIYRGLLVRGGYPSLVVPAWSPDGRMVAYLRRDRAEAQGGKADRTHSMVVMMEDHGPGELNLRQVRRGCNVQSPL